MYVRYVYKRNVLYILTWIQSFQYSNPREYRIKINTPINLAQLVTVHQNSGRNQLNQNTITNTHFLSSKHIRYTVYGFSIAYTNSSFVKQRLCYVTTVI